MISLGNHSSLIDDDEPDFMGGLTDDQKEQIGELLEQYLSAMESGVPPTVEQLTQSAPELREPLRVCVGGLESLHRMAGGESASSAIRDNQSDNNQLGDFELHETIGRGGMGVVYRATQKSLNRTVAVKILPLASVLDPRQLTRFQHEAEAAAGLQHPNIVPVHAIGYERGVHFFAMRYINGQSLEQWIEQRWDSDKNDWQTAVRYALQVADGLQAAHEYGIIHRDIKPSNLLLDQRDNVWIADFGLARIQNDPSVTGPSDVVGTARYMSPEQARGDSAIVDGRTDIYALAATLQEMLALNPTHAIGVGCMPRDLETVISKAMSLRRDDRYETAMQFADDLRRVLAGEPTIARPPTLIDRLVRQAAKHRTAVIATVFVGSLTLAGLAVGTTMLAAEKRVSDALLIQSQQDRAITREAVDRLGMQIAELLADIPAADSVRHRLLTETLDYYQRIADAGTVAIADNQQRLDLAVTYGKIGLFQSELGQPAKATHSLRESERLYAELAGNSPDDSELNLQWSISQNNLGLKLAESGDLETASTWFARAISTQKQLGDSIELARTLNNLGGMLADAGNTDESQQTYERALSLLGSESDSLRSTLQSNLAGLLTSRDPDRATSLAKESLTVQMGTLQQNSSDPELATQVLLTLNTLAEAQTATGEYHDASSSLRQAVAIGTQLHNRWPDHPSYRRDLAFSLNQLGLALSGSGELTAAREALHQAATHGRRLRETVSQNAEIEHMLGGILNNLAFVAAKIGDRTVAHEVYAEAIKHQQRAIALAPQNQKYQATLRTQEINRTKLGGES